MTGYPERFPRGNCRQNARWMTLMYPELVAVDGYLVNTAADGTEFRVEHTWNQAPDGQLVDSTAWAFEGEALPYRYEPDPQAWGRLASQIDGLRGEL
jgi:hypothetical protein